MTRRSLFAALGLGLFPEGHRHSWHLSPFYIATAVTYEEPHFYSPGGLTRLETCDCGAMRLPGDLGKERGENLAAEPKP